MLSNIIPRIPFRGHGAHYVSVFLAGGITNWRTYVKSRAEGSYENIAVIDPNDPHYDVELTTAWEFEAMHYADVVMFWFPKESANVVTMFELGWVCRDHLNKIVVGCDPEFKYYKNIVEELKQLRPDITVLTTLEETTDACFAEVSAIHENTASRRKRNCPLTSEQPHSEF